ncbi:MAG: aminoglycoside phosphotransferase family protein [Clostridia bacterium]|nr:aminoglycoside phosphotransferase family protein [Clostridia bacterium]
MDLSAVCKALNLKGELVDFEVLKGGNINTTYKINCIDGSKRYEYLLQNINKFVFREPVKVMQNIVHVTDYIEKHRDEYSLYNLVFNKTEDGTPFVIDENGNYWRSTLYINCVTFESTDNLSLIKEAGNAYGEFIYALRDFNASILYETIPNFHNTKKRINDLEKTISISTNTKKKETKKEVEYILSNKEIASTLVNLIEKGELPIRVTHNDTRNNNVVFDINTLKALAVIDLDTIMPGITAYDFADGARSICSSTADDEEDLSKVYFNLEKFEAFTKGYLKKMSLILTDKEIETLGLSVFIITLELGSRFLEDYLKGNVYFKVKYENHNLVRARCQLALAKDVMSKMSEINEIIKKYTK